jgi:hypothetical protein
MASVLKPAVAAAQRVLTPDGPAFHNRRACVLSKFLFKKRL